MCVAVLINRFICVEQFSLNPVYMFLLILSFFSINSYSRLLIRASMILVINDNAVIGLVCEAFGVFPGVLFITISLLKVS